MRRQDFSYHLPQELIAQYPANPRTTSRLLCLPRLTETYQDRQFNQLIDLLHPNDLLVFNDTKVIPARLYGKKATGGKVEILLERLLDNHQILAQIRASKAPKIGNFLHLDNNITLEVLGRQQDFFHLKFHTDQPLLDVLHDIGHIPLPPYITRTDQEIDHNRYQTVYADKPGAVAAPTAGLHFDHTLLQQLKQKGIEQSFLTLHVGAGTFQPMRVDNIKDHKIHQETIHITEDTCQKITATKARGGRIIAVGTTSVRCLETAAQTGQIQAYSGETQLFIYPGYHFNIIDAMITNFHLPESSLLMLVSAFAGQQQTLKAYQYAVEKKYRFYSYGDAMFIY